MPTSKPSLQDAVARFGKSAKAKLGNPSAVGEPEDQLRAPFEQLLADLAAVSGTKSTGDRSCTIGCIALLLRRPAL